MAKRKLSKIGIVGCGAIGEGVALFIEKQLSSDAIVQALADTNPEAARRLQKKIKRKPKTCSPTNLVKEVDLIIECASVEAVRSLLPKVFACKKDAVILSVGALLETGNILKQAKKAGAVFMSLREQSAALTAWEP